MDRWEFEWCRVPDGENTIELLDIFGMQGWDYTGTTRVKGSCTDYLMKRELE